MYSIRDHRLEDFPAIYALDQACFPAGIAYSREELKHLTEMDSAVTLVVEAKGQGLFRPSRKPSLAGFAIAEKTSPRGVAVGHLITIDIEPGLQRGGCGSALLAALERRMASGKVSQMRLEVAADNVAAQRFYLKSGYSLCGRIERYYLGLIDALLMEKTLASA